MSWWVSETSQRTFPPAVPTAVVVGEIYDEQNINAKPP